MGVYFRRADAQSGVEDDIAGGEYVAPNYNRIPILVIGHIVFPHRALEEAMSVRWLVHVRG